MLGEGDNWGDDEIDIDADVINHQEVENGDQIEAEGNNHEDNDIFVPPSQG